MKKLALTILAALAIATPVMAYEKETLTAVMPNIPYETILALRDQVTALQGWIQDELNKELTDHDERIKALEVKTGKALLLTDEESKTAAADAYRFRAATVERLQELERKVAGMQKQITLLHSKKADKETK